ncbi:aspC [Symbiodinium sp. CCMP2592]|nr:aspC [Symbiodinium sp. CCMP2592]
MAASAAPLIQVHATDGGLASCLGIARVKAELATFMKDTLKMESLQDFFFYVAKDAWEAELDTKVVTPAVTATVITEGMKAIQLARVRMAWQSAAKLQDVVETQAAGSGSADDPLPETARQLLDQRWKKRYPDFVLDPALMGASAIIHRLYREWVQGQPTTVIDLQKMRTALAERFQGDKLQIALGDATLTVTDYASTGSRVQFRSVSHFYLLHRTLTNCWAYVGSGEVESKNRPGTQVVQMSFQQALGYSDTILRKAVDVPEPSQLVWMSRNDSLTRSRMAAHMMQGWPPGEALERALAETVEWAMLPALGESELRGPSHSPLDALGREPSTKRTSDGMPSEEALPRKKITVAGSPSKPGNAKARQQTVTTLKGNKTLCKAWNDDRHCQRAKAGEQCPDGWHLCDVKLPSGRGCGGKHRRDQCPNDPQSSLQQAEHSGDTGAVSDRQLLMGQLASGVVGLASRRVIQRGGSVEKDGQLQAFRYCNPSDVHARLEASKPLAWRGRGDLPSFPWSALGTWLVIDLWSGMAGTLFACMSLGLRVYAISVEQDHLAAERTARSFPNVISLQFVEDFRGSMIRGFLKRRSVEGVIVGGGSPCQGNSSLNRHRRGLGDSRSCQPEELARIYNEIMSLDEVHGLKVRTFLENVASSPRAVVRYYNQLMETKPLLVRAAQFGWVQRDRLFWLGSLGDLSRVRLPPEARVEVTDLGWSLTVKAVARFQKDACRFPVEAYEDISLAWRQGEWRTLTPSERASIHCIPPDAVGTSTPHHLPQEQRTKVRNSWIGNGFHIPCATLIIFMLVSEASAVPSPMQCVFEQHLRGSLPGQRTVDNVVSDVQAILASFPGCSEAPWSRVRKRLRGHSIHPLFSFKLFLWHRGLNEETEGPSWVGQRNRALLQAAVGKQRAAGDSRKGLDHLLPPGLSKHEHIHAACGLKSPFDVDGAVDPDLEFAAWALGVWGPLLPAWQDSVRKCLHRLVKAFQPVEDFLMSASPVAGLSTRSPLALAVFTVLLDWPDTSQPLRYLTGFKAVGAIEPTGVFREIPHTEHVSQDEFLGEAAMEFIHDLVHRVPSPDAQAIWDLTKEECDKGWCSGPFSVAQLDQQFGQGQWRPVPRFLVTQASGKQRLIDDVVLHFWGELPDWFLPTACIMDLPEAYRGCPVEPQQRAFTIAATFDPEGRRWCFWVYTGLLYGLSSAVLSFNRLPTLLVAVARRLIALGCGAYFDDLFDIAVRCIARSSQDALLHVLALAGAPPAPDKTQPPRANFGYLGAAFDFSSIKEDGIITCGPTSASLQKLQDSVAAVAESGQLSPAVASKLRGQAGWTGSLLHGKCGRLALRFLKQRQYATDGDRTVTPSQLQELRLLVAISQEAPVKYIDILQPPRQPVVVYSDASYESGVAKCGWVVFSPHCRPVGQALTVPPEWIASWEPRETQIFAAEAFCSLLVPFNLPHLFRGQDIIWFIDNEAAAAAVIRGSSGSIDVDMIVQLSALFLLRLNARLWVEWINSDANCSDGLSRDGVHDEWTLDQGWDLSVAQLPSPAIHETLGTLGLGFDCPFRVT